MKETLLTHLIACQSRYCSARGKVRYHGPLCGRVMVVCYLTVDSSAPGFQGLYFVLDWSIVIGRCEVVSINPRQHIDMLVFHVVISGPQQFLIG